MARKYTQEQKEYARLRKNYLARVRYQLKKHKSEYSEEMYNKLYSEKLIPTAKEIAQRDLSLSEYSNIATNYSDIMNQLDNLLSYVEEEPEPDLPLTSEIGRQKLIDALKESYVNFYTITDDGHVMSNFTGEVFSTTNSLLEDLEYNNFHNAIQEGEEIINKLLQLIDAHTSAGDEKSRDKSVSYQAADVLKSQLMDALAVNKDAVALKVHVAGEELLDTVDEVMHYTDGNVDSDALAELSWLFTVSSDYSKALDEYLNSVSPTAHIYTGNHEEDFYDT